MADESTGKGRILMSHDPKHILKHLVAFNTVSEYLEAEKDFSIIEYVQGWLEKNGFSCEIIENEGLQHILASLKPTRELEMLPTTFPRILFLGHLDTVPFDSAEWGDLDPLVLTEDHKKHVAYGRGSQDCKGNVAALLAAARELHDYWQEALQAKRPFSIYLAFTTDEEVGGERGARYLATLLKKRNELPTAVINIDTTFMPTIRRRGAFNVIITSAPKWIWINSTAITRRYRLEASRTIQGENEGPHAAYFIAGCDVHPLIAIAKHFFTKPHAWAVSFEGQFLAGNIIPAQVTVEALKGPVLNDNLFSNDKKDDIMSFEQQDGFERVNATITLLLRKIIPAVKAFFPTDKPSAYGINVTPNVLVEREDGTVILKLDVRAMLSSTIPLIESMKTIFKDVPSTKLEIKGTPGYLYTDEQDPLVQSLLSVLQQKGLSTIPVERGGATDSRFFSPLGIPCVEIGVDGGNVHGPREFVDLRSLEQLPGVYVDLVKEYVKRLLKGEKA